MSAVVSEKKRERQSVSQAPARHSGEGRNPEPLTSALERKGSGDTKLPTGWKLTTLGAEFRWGSGGTPKSSNPAFYDGGIPWAIIGDLNDGPVDSTARTISEAGLRNSSAKLVEPGSVLVAMYGSIGKLGIASVPLATNQAIAFTKPECCSAKFLFWYLYFARSQLIKLGKGGTQSNISQTVLKSFPFVLPPAEEQEHIVAEIEKQFTRLDAGVAALRRVQVNLKRYRAAVLKAACEGRLVPTEAELARAEARTYETGEQLLARILSDRRKNWSGRGKYKEPAVPDATSLPLLPEGWVWASVEQLLKESLCNGISVKGSDHPPGVRSLRLSAMSNSGFDYSDARYLPLSESDVDDLWIQEGDFFISRGNGSLHLVGRGTCAQRPPRPIIFPDTMIRLRLAGVVCKSGLIRTVWPSRIIRSQIEVRVKTTAGIYKIAQPQVGSIAIPFPPLAEQIRIVAEVERRLSVIEELEVAVTANLQRATRLRQSILRRAFE